MITSSFCSVYYSGVFLLFDDGAVRNSGPVVNVGQEGVIIGVPHNRSDVRFFIRGFWVAESHSLWIHKLHHLHTTITTILQTSLYTDILQFLLSVSVYDTMSFCTRVCYLDGHLYGHLSDVRQRWIQSPLTQLLVCELSCQRLKHTQHFSQINPQNKSSHTRKMILRCYL